MIRYLAAFLLPALMFLGTVPPASAQRPPPPGAWRGADLSGRYINQSNGGECWVERRGRGYVFINENGSRARFQYTGPGRLAIVAGDWDPNVVATVLGDRRGRTVIRFDSPGAAPGSWVSSF